ncbi:hypothetical protein CA3LBN_001235 [Candidozyma haemuli]|uniref:GH16 domain-containing protein n=2 Tax=Candidozyma TaxID=3303203 RepID=A0ABX8I1S6_9ASCO|nr:hypothetical protein CA3LBN_001235 [[Candida] haemuloni]
MKLTRFSLILAGVLAIDSPCNPAKEWSCVARNRALSAAVQDTMTVQPKYFESNLEPPFVEYGLDGGKMKIFERGQNPQLASNHYIMYGRAEAEVKASHGKSVISSMYMQSDDLDEIDIGEFFGGETDKFQTNYFIKGNISNYDRDRYHKAHADVTADYHKYAVEWTPESIMWFFDGRLIRRVLSAGNDHGFPASPMRLMFSLWIGGDPENHPGTIEWAGGEADFEGLPYVMGIRNIRLVDYSNGQQYVYGRGQEVDATSGEIFGRRKRDGDGEVDDDRKKAEVPMGTIPEDGTKVSSDPDKVESTGRSEYDIEYEFDQGIESGSSALVVSMVLFLWMAVVLLAFYF